MQLRARSISWAALVLVFAIACGDDDGDGSTAGESASSTSTTGESSSGSTTTAGGSSSTTDAPTDGTTADPSTTGDGSTGTGSSATSDSGGTDSGGSTGEGTGSTGSTGGGFVSDDPFDPASCGGTAWSASDATDRLGGTPREVLTDATIQIRTRTCPAGVCGDWGAPENWVISYLTWSGGVVTAFKDFQADMQLVLFDDEDTPRLSVQHVTFDIAGYPDTDGMVYDLPPTVIDLAHVRAYDDDPDFDYYYQDLDWLVRNGTLVLGEDCARWVADPYVQQPPYTEQYAALFRW
jgi:hypothetical protein